MQANKNNIKFGLALFAVILAVWVPQYISQVQNNHIFRQGCERLDKVRTIQYRELKDEIKKARENNDLQTAVRKEARALILLNSARAYANQENSIHVDCKKAYPLPFPANIFD